MRQVPKEIAPQVTPAVVTPILKKTGMRITDFAHKKAIGEKITMLTCYDYPSAKLVAETPLDCVLVGDSLAMVVHGHESTITATMDMMVLHTKAVARGLGSQLLVSDLPFLCHRVSREDTVNNVKRLLEAGAKAIKIEGGDADTCDTISYLVTAGVPIIGHIGLTPQSILALGSYKIQGKTEAQAAKILEQARHLEKAGCTALVLECIPEPLAKTITEALTIPTIGIGASSATDGQVLVWHDMLGLQSDYLPKFVKQFAQATDMMLEAIHQYVHQVKSTQFPALEHSWSS
jgi:3-methyl-2-oxobutanoate hydroxymethyltransferase